MQFSQLQLSTRKDCALCGSIRSNLENSIPVEPVAQTALHTEDLSPQLLADKIKISPPGPDSFQLIDVRTPMEFHEGSIPGATLIPLAELEDRLTDLDPKREIVLYCHLGIRSRNALEFLKSEGFSNIRHLKQGTWSWEQAGYSLVQPSI